MLQAWYEYDDSLRSEAIEAFRENELKDGREVKRALKVSQSTQGIYVCAVAEAKDDFGLLDNRILTVPVSGEPLNRECYDTIRDVYVTEGVDWIEVGSIPVNYVLHIDDNWTVDVPVPPSVIKRYLDQDQKKFLNQWKSKWDGNYYRIGFLQSLLVY